MKEITIQNVLEIINPILEKEILEEQCDDNLLELGMDSIKFIQIIVSLEEYFGCTIPDEKLLLNVMNSVNNIIQVLQLAVNEGEEAIYGQE